MPDPQNILVLIPNWLGDVAMCTPALRALHKRYPGATLSVAGRASACDLLSGIEWIQHFHVLPTRPGLGEMRSAAQSLKPFAKDLTVVLPHSFRAALLARLIGSTHRLGYARGRRSMLLTHRVAPHRVKGTITPVYMAEEYTHLVAALGCAGDDEGLELVADSDPIETVRAGLPQAGPVIGFAPGAAFGPSKCWLPERYAAVADALAEEFNATCVLFTGPGEEETARAVQTAARHKLIRCDDDNPSITRLKAGISQLDLLIGNDSGPRHLAIAFKVPVICLMGSTAPVYSSGPYESGRIHRVDVDCGPCQKPICTTDHRCMSGITSAEVVESARHWLHPRKVVSSD